MPQTKPHDDLAQIRAIMERSTKFLSLSAFSSVLAGVYALIGAGLAYRHIYSTDRFMYGKLNDDIFDPDTLPLVYIAGIVLLLAVSTVLWMSYRKARQAGQALWSQSARRVFINFAIPMITGGIFVLVLFTRGYYGLLAASTLIFYGLALINAGNFTFSDIRTLGMWQILLGLLASIFPGQGLLFWTLGFGVLHILYGVLMYWKYERK